MLSGFKFAACGKENTIYYMKWSLPKQKEKDSIALLSTGNQAAIKQRDVFVHLVLDQ